MSEEIIIKTETVKVEELQGREKTIYDYAYKKGLYDGDKSSVLTRTLAIICLIIFAVGIIKAFFDNI